MRLTITTAAPPALGHKITRRRELDGERGRGGHDREGLGESRGVPADRVGRRRGRDESPHGNRQVEGDVEGCRAGGVGHDGDGLEVGLPLAETTRIGGIAGEEVDAIPTQRRAG